MSDNERTLEDFEDIQNELSDFAWKDVQDKCNYLAMHINELRHDLYRKNAKEKIVPYYEDGLMPEEVAVDQIQSVLRYADKLVELLQGLRRGI